jgi:hypothetical protein
MIRVMVGRQSLIMCAGEGRGLVVPTHSSCQCRPSESYQGLLVSPELFAVNLENAPSPALEIQMPGHESLIGT